MSRKKNNQKFSIYVRPATAKKLVRLSDKLNRSYGEVVDMIFDKYINHSDV